MQPKIRHLSMIKGHERRSVVMDEPKTLTVPEAGRRYFSLGRNASYEAARRGEIPTIRIGRLLRVPIVALERKLEDAGHKEIRQ
jgi:hypothetical protein